MSEQLNIDLEVVITKHAYERAKERLSWTEKVLDKMAQKAFSIGISHKDTKGGLNKYITKIWFDYKTANNVKIHGEVIYLFNKNTLITVYQLPNDLRKKAKNVKGRKI
jgi:hypothetical protein